MLLYMNWPIMALKLKSMFSGIFITESAAVSAAELSAGIADIISVRSIVFELSDRFPFIMSPLNRYGIKFSRRPATVKSLFFPILILLSFIRA